jgi:hypothetical protein
LKLMNPDGPITVRVREKKEAIHDTEGRLVREAQRALYAKFHRFSAPEWARQIGRETFQFPTCPQDVDPGDWLAYMDTDDEAREYKWTGEERAAVESKLLEIAPLYGYMVVDKPRQSPPWPAYDKLVAQGQRTNVKIGETIVRKVVEDGYDPAAVASYERENLCRPEVVDALESLIAAPAPAEPEEELVEA